MAEQPSAAERLPGHLLSRLADLRAMLDRDDPDEGDDELPALYDYGLGSEVRYSIRVDLSTGGPADYVTATVSAEGDVLDAQYHFADWWDHAQQSLTGPELRTVEEWLGALFDLSSLGEYIRR